MKGFKAFIYSALLIFAIIGGAGYSFYSGQPQFGISLLLCGLWVALAFFKVVELPTKDDFQK